jgi:hypothetical protein
MHGYLLEIFSSCCFNHLSFFQFSCDIVEAHRYIYIYIYNIELRTVYDLKFRIVLTQLIKLICNFSRSSRKRNNLLETIQRKLHERMRRWYYKIGKLTKLISWLFFDLETISQPSGSHPGRSESEFASVSSETVITLGTFRLSFDILLRWKLCAFFAPPSEFRLVWSEGNSVTEFCYKLLLFLSFTRHIYLDSDTLLRNTVQHDTYFIGSFRNSFRSNHEDKDFILFIQLS